MAQIDNIPQNEKTLESLSKINQNFNNLNTDKLEAGSTETLTNKTINAENNTVTELTTESIKTTSKTGQGTKLVTGTNGTDGFIAKWDVNGNAIGSSVTETELEDLKSDATLNTDTDVSGNDWVLDEDDFASDSATKVPTQQSVKAYVETSASALSTVQEVVVAMIRDDGSIGSFTTDDLNTKVYTSTTLMAISSNGQYREYLPSDFTNIDRPLSACVYQNSVYVLGIDSTFISGRYQFHLVRISGIDDLSTATQTEIDITTNAGILGQTGNTLGSAISIVDGFVYLRDNTSPANTLYKAEIIGDTLGSKSTVTLTGQTLSISQQNFAVGHNGDIYTKDSFEYERFNSSGVSQEYAASFLSIINSGKIMIYNTDSETLVYELDQNIGKLIPKL